MRYLGGKSWIAKPIAERIAWLVGQAPVWEPFCGGLSCTVELAKRMDRVRASDCHPALMSLYREMQQTSAALRNGRPPRWDPPCTVTREDYELARQLPDSDPLKGFIGFGASFGGRWFQGFASDQDGYNYAKGTRQVLLRQFQHLGHVEFECQSFFDVEPGTWKGVIYCDPPYQDSKRYTTGDFDHQGFWNLCARWASAGCRVFVSEFQCPIDHKVRWSIERNWSIARSVNPKARVDQLFEIVPSGHQLPPDDSLADLEELERLGKL